MPRPTEENGCHSDSWFSLHLLVRHSCWGAKTRDQGETEGLAVGGQGPWGFPWCGCSEHRLMELGRPAQMSADPSLCARALGSREQGTDYPARPHGADTGPASLLPLWAAPWLTHTCCTSSAHTCTSHPHRCLVQSLRAARSPARRTERPARPSPRPEHLPTMCTQSPTQPSCLPPKGLSADGQGQGHSRVFLHPHQLPKTLLSLPGMLPALLP